MWQLEMRLRIYHQRLERSLERQQQELFRKGGNGIRDACDLGDFLNGRHV